MNKKFEDEIVDQVEEKEKMNDNLQRLADIISANLTNSTKEVLTSDEAAQYLGMQKSYLYKLTMLRQIPHYKPMGKMVFFKRTELEQWLLSNRIATDDEIQQEAINYCMKNGGSYAR